MKVFLIRHAEQEYPYDAQGRKLVSGVEAPLVELGKRQMQELKGKLAEEGQILDAVYTSPLLRARQSAEILADVLSVPIYVFDGLKDDEPNSAEGHTYDELEEIGGDIYAHPFSENQETLDHLVRRSRAAMQFILSDAKERGYKTIGIVGHGDPLCALDWSIKHEGYPSSYAEMKKESYPQKGEACEYTIGPDLRIIGEGRIITTESAKQTIEGFRNSRHQEAEV